MQTPWKVEVSALYKYSDFDKISFAEDRITPTLTISRGKKVLNIGCTGSDALISSLTVHHSLADVADSCLGIDIFEAGVKKMQADGENVMVADAEELDLDEKDFDVAVLGEVIEHITNPGLVLKAVHNHLKAGGKIILTTPHPFSLRILIKRLLTGSSPVNSDHIAWYDPIYLKWLLERNNFVVTELVWCAPSQRQILKVILKFRPDFHNDFALIAHKPL